MTGQIQPRSAAPLARPIMPTAPMAAAQPTMTLQDALGFLRRHGWKRIVLPIIIGLMLGVVSYALFNRFLPSYVSFALIQVFPQGLKDIGTIEDLSPNKDIMYQSRNTIAEYLKSPDFQRTLLSNNKIRATSWFLREADSKRFWDFLFPTDIEGKFLRYFKKYFRSQPSRESEYVQVSFRCYGANGNSECALILNEILRTFQQTWKEKAEAKTSGQLGALTKQQQTLRGTLDTSQQTLDKIQLSYSFGNLSAVRFRDYLEEKLANLETQFSALDSEITRLTSEVGFLENRAKSDYDAVVREQIEQDPVASQMRQRLNDLELLLSGQMASFGENHRRVKETRDSRDQAVKDLQARQKQIGDIVRQSQFILTGESLAAQKQELESRKKQLNDGRDEHRKIGLARAEYEKQEATRDEARKQYDEINALISKYNAILFSDLSRVLVYTAVEPREKDSPRVLVHVIGYLIVGLIVGLAFAFFIEMRYRVLRLRTNDFRRLSVPLLGRICHKDTDDEVVGADMFHVVRQAHDSMMCEDYRQFRVNLRLSETAANKKILLVTSPAAGDGKTTVAANLASTMLWEGRRVLFIDANFRQPKSDKVYPLPAGKEPDFGLSNYLLGQSSDPHAILRPSGIEGLDVIDAGPIPKNSTEVLGSKAMRKLLDTFRDSYDYILIDGPAMLVSDALALAALAEGTIVVFNAARINKGQAERILNELNNIQATVLGSVLVGVKEVKGGYFEERYLAYQKYHESNNPIVKPVN
jgi:capsular exopolysaccharide synthesis family protein